MINVFVVVVVAANSCIYYNKTNTQTHAHTHTHTHTHTYTHVHAHNTNELHIYKKESIDYISFFIH